MNKFSEMKRIYLVGISVVVTAVLTYGIMKLANNSDYPNEDYNNYYAENNMNNNDYHSMHHNNYGSCCYGMNHNNHNGHYMNHNNNNEYNN